MNDIESRLIKGNKQFIDKVKNNPNYKTTVKKLVNGQSPYAIVLTCSDSRVVPEEIFSSFLGELFVIRSAGNVVNDGELASVEYGIKHLNIKYVLVLAHTHCGAIHATIKNEKGEYIGYILDIISKQIHSEQDEVKASELNALGQVKYLKEKFPDYDGVIKAGIYDIEDCSFRFLGE